MRRAVVLLALALVLVPFGPVAASPPPYRSSVRPLSASIRALMRGSSWRPGCPVGLNDLRVVGVTFWGFDRQAHHARLVVHRTVARDVAGLFGKLYAARFPIRRIRLVDRYGADDKRSMSHDNTSAFNCRYRNGVCCTWSMHAYGKAIDINPVEDPELWSGGVAPPNGAVYADRWKAFHAIGWGWGGDWSWPIDYQHFSTNGK